MVEDFSKFKTGSNIVPYTTMTNDKEDKKGLREIRDPSFIHDDPTRHAILHQ
jgi:hypothetical protein